jgi:hypothetical protein
MTFSRITQITALSFALSFAMFAAAQSATPTPKGVARPNTALRTAPTVSAAKTTTNAPGAMVQYPPVQCSQSHPGEGDRTRDVFSKGDSHMSKSVADHVVNYAIQRFQLAAFVKPTDIERARGELYEHLKWKLGNPPAIAAQFLTAGYQHFDNAFVYEAAAALVNFQLPGEKNGPDWKIPKAWADYLHKMAEADGSRLGSFLEKKWQIPHDEAYKIESKLTGAANNAIENVGFNVPKNWNIDHNMVLGMIATAKGAPSSGAPSAPAVVRSAATLR